jgi:hypothetical protein
MYSVYLLRHRQDLNLRGHCPMDLLCFTVETDIAFNDISANIFLLIFTYQIFTVDRNLDRLIDQVPIKFTVTRSKLCSSFLKSARPPPQNLAPICAECRHDGERDDMAVSITSPQRDVTSPSVGPTSLFRSIGPTRLQMPTVSNQPTLIFRPFVPFRPLTCRVKPRR